MTYVSSGTHLEKNLRVAVASRRDKQREYDEFRDGFPEAVVNQWDAEISTWHEAQHAVHIQIDAAKERLKDAQKVDNPYEEIESGKYPL